MKLKLNLAITLTALTIHYQTFAQDAADGSNRKTEIKVGSAPTIYNFLRPQIGSAPSNFYIRKNVQTYFVLEDINKSLYNISINNTDKSWYGEKPAIFNVLTEVDVSKLNKALETEKKGNGLGNEQIFGEVDVSADLKKASNEFRAKRQSLTGPISAYKNQYGLLQLFNKLYQNFNLLLEDGCRPFSEIKNEKIKLGTELLTKEFQDNDKDEIHIGTKLNEYSKEQLKKLLTANENISKTQTSIKELKAGYLEKLNSELIKNKSTLASLSKTQTNIKAADKAKKASLEKANTVILSEINSLAEVSTLIEESLIEIKTANNTVLELDKANFPASLKKSYDKINKTNWTYTSSTFTAKKDVMIIKFDIQPKELQPACSGNYNTFNTEITGEVTGFKINFSTGLFLLQGKNMFDRTYRTETISGDSVNNILIENTNKSKIAPSVGALMHFYHQSPYNVNFGGAFGLSVNNETNLTYHGGISVLFGKEQRLILSGGASLGRIKMISDEYAPGGKIPKAVTTIPTANFYKWGTFISFTYNLSTL